MTLFIVNDKSLSSKSSLSRTGGRQVHRQLQQTAMSAADPRGQHPDLAGADMCVPRHGKCPEHAGAGRRQDKPMTVQSEGRDASQDTAPTACCHLRDRETEAH